MNSISSAPPDVDGMRERIRAAAIDLFASKGFHGTSVRDLARAVGIEAASLYHHYPSKQDLLFALFDQIMDDLLEMLRTATLAPGSPLERLRAATRAHVLYHIAHRKEAFVSHSELRSLTPAHRRLIIAKRDRYERLLRAVIEEGVASGRFEVADIALTSTALLVMCSGVSDWIQPRGRLSPDEVADRYVEMALRIVAAPGADDKPTAPTARR